MIDKECAKEKLGITNMFKTFKFKRDFNINNPTYFHADGLTVFVGAQGTGKTLSAVNYVYKLMQKYPYAKLVTNIMLTDYPIVTFEEFIKKNYNKLISLNYDQLSEFQQDSIYIDYLFKNRVFAFNNADDLMRYYNLDEGVIYLIDEIQLYFNSLESKNINMEVMTQISQQRKQRKHIVATSQVFGRMSKALREQFNTVINCKNYLGLLQVNELINRDDIEISSNDSMGFKGVISSRFVYFHSPFMYKKYDTYYLIDKNKFVSGEEQKGGLYDTDIRVSTDD